MAIQIQGNAGTVAEVGGTTHRALRTERRSADYGSLGFYRLSQQSGTMGVSIGGGSEIYQFRWTDATRLAAIYSIELSAGGNVAATTAVLAAFEAVIARSFTVAGTGGVAATITGNNAKLRTSGMGTTLLGESRVASTAALGAGTKTLDTQGIGCYAFGIGTAAITAAESLDLTPGVVQLFNAQGDHPIILATNEGFVIRTGVNAFPAGMTWTFGVNVTWAELAAY